MKVYGQLLSWLFFCDWGSGLVVNGGALVIGGGSICGDYAVLALVMDFREVMLISPPELAHCTIFLDQLWHCTVSG